MNNSFNIGEIIDLVRQQKPKRRDVVKALQNTIGGQWTSKGYYSFVDSRNANERGAEWQFEENIVLEQVNKSDIFLDILKSGRIGGIEFIDRIDK